MTKEELQQRIEKKQQDIAKKERNLVKYIVDDEFTAMCDRYFQTADKTELLQYKKDHNLMWLPEYYGKRLELEDAKKTLNKYIVELDKLNNFDNEEKIEVIWNFLQDWKEKTYQWFLLNSKKYFELKKDEKEEYAKFLKSEYGVEDEKELDWRSRSTAQHRFMKDYYFSIHSLTKEIVSIKYKYTEVDLFKTIRTIDSYTVDEELLMKKLDKDVKTKYTNLINEITHITGEITDASCLRIGGKGDINGTVKGVKGTANVNTFMAGIYHIVQCPHYRTKVTRVN